MILAILPPRGADDYGSGDYGAPRGDRTHNGVDYACPEDSVILAPVDGQVTKLGYCYSDDLSYRYVEITDAAHRRHRLFYVNPTVGEGKKVVAEISEIGKAQDIAKRYPPTNRKPKGMKNHVHYEVKTAGTYVDPESV